jgi:nuclear pore complex protein Nup133
VNANFWPILPPSDVLGVFTENLDARFDVLDEVSRARILEAMKAEDARLHIFIEKHQLEKWHGTILEHAQKDFKYKFVEGEQNDNSTNASENGNA